MDFSISSEIRPPEADITVAGELDVFTSQQLRDRLQEAIDTGCRLVLLDLGGVTFVDASALGVITVARRSIGEAGGSLHLVAWSSRVLRVCRLAGLDSAFGMTDSQPA
jgi:anti-sigma B factor antagonist